MGDQGVQPCVQIQDQLPVCLRVSREVVKFLRIVLQIVELEIVLCQKLFKR
jgi:hypothetical protein